MNTETQMAKLSTGQLIPLFQLSAVNRQGQLGPPDYKQHRNLILIFFRSVECRKCKQLLREIAVHYGEYQQMEAEVLAISADGINHLRQLARDLVLPFPVLTDSDGKITNLYMKQNGQSSETAAPEAAVFVADRWGAIFTHKVAEKELDLLAEAEIREWLEFIEVQCEEYHSSEWPL